MPLTLQLPDDFSNDFVTDDVNVVQFVADQNWEALAAVPVCIDRHGTIVANFGQNIWNCGPYCANKGGNKNQHEFDFGYLENSPGLLIQAKLIAYGWMYHVGHKGGKLCKLSTVAGRFNVALKRVLQSLMQQGVDDLCALQRSIEWTALENHLSGANLGTATIVQTLTALNAVVRLGDWLPFKLELPDIEINALAKKLAGEGKLYKKQTLAIPQKQADILYGEAVRLVEQAWPHRGTLTQLEQSMQANYNAGRALVDSKIASGKWQFLHDTNGQLDTHGYAQAINSMMPQPQAAIITKMLNGTGLLPSEKVNGNWLVLWRSQLQAACFICCGAFTGMRVSELFELHCDSFYTRQIDGHSFHLVRASTHKLTGGKKNDEWLASPIAKKAIELATALSASLRGQLLNMAAHTANSAYADQLRDQANCLWLSQKNRSNIPIIIDRNQWNKRLQRFSKQVGALVDDATIAECRLLNPQHNGAIEAKVKLGKPWPLTTHQFRRTFACFAVRNHLGHPIAIKQQFKHLYLRMSEWYGNGAVAARLDDVQIDSELQRLLDQVGIEHTTATYDKWFNGDEPLSGSYGKAVVAMRDDKPVIYSSWDNLYRMVKEKRLTLHGTLHSYCKNGYNCDMDGVANPAFCVECSAGGSIIDGEQAQWWKKRHSALTTYLSEQADVSQGEYAHCITQIRAAERVMGDHKLDHETYKHPIELINL